MKMMLRNLSLLLVLSCFLTNALQAQEDKSKRPSPPASITQKVGEVTVTIDYSSPSVKGRTIWGALVPFNEVWRTGANEATTFAVDKDVTINGQKLAAGKYALFTIPTDGDWTVIFNKDANQWGAYGYKETADALRVKVTPSKAKEFSEMLHFYITPSGLVSMAWENLIVGFTVK